MTLTIAITILLLDREALPVTRGWHLDGAGPARYGWGYRHATGRVTYLGATWRDVRDSAERTQALALLRAGIDDALAEGGAP
jgi:hypothetical protein